MTAEIAIVNRQAIALAADSAVTIGQERVWKRSNKLFSLGPHNDIAIMIWGAGEFAGHPWEMVVKTFRAENTTRWAKVEECASAFMRFLEDKRFLPDQDNRRAHLALFFRPLSLVADALPPKASKLARRAAALDECTKHIAQLQKIPLQDTPLPFSDFLNEFTKPEVKDLLHSLIQDVWKVHLPQVRMRRVLEFLWEFYRRKVASSYETGVVVAGYGADELFPCVVEHHVDGKNAIYVRTWLTQKIDNNEDSSKKSAIIPFAQSDIIHLFMEGIAPEYLTYIETVLARLMKNKSESLIQKYISDAGDQTTETTAQQRDNQTLVTEFLKNFEVYRRNTVVERILAVVAGLPKEEMAEMATALVELTSLRRKVDSNLETVGGPVDIALISKGDGLIWIKRKHYFDLERNRDFLYRKFGFGSGQNAS